MARKRKNLRTLPAGSCWRSDDIGPVVVSHESIAENARKLIKYARTNPNDAAYRFLQNSKEVSIPNKETDDGG